MLENIKIMGNKDVIDTPHTLLQYGIHIHKKNRSDVFPEKIDIDILKNDNKISPVVLYKAYHDFQDTLYFNKDKNSYPNTQPIQYTDDSTVSRCDKNDRVQLLEYIYPNSKS